MWLMRRFMSQPASSRVLRVAGKGAPCKCALTQNVQLALFCKIGGKGWGFPGQVSVVEIFLNVDTRVFVSGRAGLGLNERAWASAYRQKKYMYGGTPDAGYPDCQLSGSAWPWGFQEADVPRYQDSLQMKVVRLSALRTGHLFISENIPGTHFC